MYFQINLSCKQFHTPPVNQKGTITRAETRLKENDK